MADAGAPFRNGLERSPLVPAERRVTWRAAVALVADLDVAFAWWTLALAALVAAWCSAAELRATWGFDGPLDRHDGLVQDVRRVHKRSKSGEYLSHFEVTYAFDDTRGIRHVATAEIEDPPAHWPGVRRVPRGVPRRPPPPPSVIVETPRGEPGRARLVGVTRHVEDGWLVLALLLGGAALPIVAWQLVRLPRHLRALRHGAPVPGTVRAVRWRGLPAGVRWCDVTCDYELDGRVWRARARLADVPGEVDLLVDPRWPRHPVARQALPRTLEVTGDQVDLRGAAWPHVLPVSLTLALGSLAAALALLAW